MAAIQARGLGGRPLVKRDGEQQHRRDPARAGHAHGIDEPGADQCRLGECCRRREAGPGDEVAEQKGEGSRDASRAGPGA